MSGVGIPDNVSIGGRTLINARALNHHAVSVGQYAETSPGAIITGVVRSKDFSTIGAGATI